jgi:hypothetical protein
VAGDTRARRATSATVGEWLRLRWSDTDVRSGKSFETGFNNLEAYLCGVSRVKRKSGVHDPWSEMAVAV